MLVQQFLESSAALWPAKTALVCHGQRWTYGALESAANRLANALIESGLEPGDRVAVHLPNGVEAVVAIFAILKAGGVFVVLNKSTKPEKLSYILNDAGAVGLIAAPQPELLAQIDASVPSLRFFVVTNAAHRQTPPAHAPVFDYTAALRSSPDVRPPSRIIDLDLACLVYTSGSTGDPKGVMSDHGNVVFASGSIIEYLRNSESDIVLNVLPLSFDYGLYQLLMVFRFGGTLILEDSFAYPAEILRRIEEERVTGFPGVPTIFSMLLAMDLGGFDLSSLRYITNTAAALPVSHIMALREKFPGVALYSMYGLTETKRTLYLPPEELERRPGSVGKAIPGTEVWLEDSSGKRLGPNRTGELVVRGRHVMRGYWRSPDATALRYRPGPLPGERFCHTGDLFRMDEDGYFYFVARQDDIIKSRGEKVAPKEVENVVCALKGVLEAAVVGVPDPLLGEAVKAIVVPKPGYALTEAGIIAHCRARLEDFMVPKSVEFRGELPKTAAGKIARTELKLCAGSPVS